MNIFKIIKKVLTEPDDFFKKVAKGKDNLSFAFGYFALLSLFAGILSWTVNLLLPISNLGNMFGHLFGKSSILVMVIIAIFSYLFGLGLSFLYAGILHVWILIFKGKNTYVKTYELGAYAGTPSLLLSWFPFIGGLIGMIWSLVLLIIGTQHVHKIDRKTAILMYVIPVVIIFFLGLIAIFVGFFLMATLGSQVGSTTPFQMLN